MKRDGLILAGGILAILRGVFGTFSALALVPSLGAIEQAVPGLALLVMFELLVSIAVLAIGIFAVVKANETSQGKNISNLGLAIIGAGIVDLLWGLAVLGPSGIAGGIGSLFALLLIGGLLRYGGIRLQRAAN